MESKMNSTREVVVFAGGGTNNALGLRQEDVEFPMVSFSYHLE